MEVLWEDFEKLNSVPSYFYFEKNISFLLNPVFH